MDASRAQNALIELAIPGFIFLILFELYYSIKRKKSFYKFSDTIADLSLGVVQQMFGLPLAMFTFYCYEKVYSNVSLRPILSEKWFSPASLLSWVLVFILLDFLYYLFHRSAHTFNLFWASHVAHHSSEEYNLAVALRQSAFQAIFSLPFYLVLALLGVPFIMFGYCYGLNLIYQFWIHTQVVSSLGPLEWIMNTPSDHRVHHGRNLKYLDKNHAGVFIIWDRLFGSFVPEEETPIYGITTPLETYSPITSNLHHFRFVWKCLTHSKNVSEGFLSIFGSPGWQPEILGGPVIPKEPPKSSLNVHTHDSAVDPVILKTSDKIFSFVFFFLILILSTIVLKLVRTESVLLISVFSIFVIASLEILGEILDGKAKTRSRAHLITGIIFHFTFLGILTSHFSNADSLLNTCFFLGIFSSFILLGAATKSIFTSR